MKLRQRQTARKSTAGKSLEIAKRRAAVKRRFAGPDPTSKVPYETITDPILVNKPVSGMVSTTMKNCWKVYNRASMCIIFDAVSPVRVFKKGTEYDDDDDDPFPIYDSRNDGDLTETDEDGTLSQYRPTAYE